MKDKHYIPEIEEFHVGFESNLLLNNGVWQHDIFFGLSEVNNYVRWIGDGRMRVKHLDRKDIESLEWKHDKDWIEKDRQMYHKTVPYRGEDKICSILYIPKTNWIVIYMNTEGIGAYVMEMPENNLTICGSVLFAGTIKNKSELKRILKQIGICQA